MPLTLTFEQQNPGTYFGVWEQQQNQAECYWHYLGLVFKNDLISRAVYYHLRVVIFVHVQ